MPKKYTSEERIEAFWAKVAIATDNGACWEWLGFRTNDGYGQMKWDRRAQKAHRVSWILANGEIPNNLWVLHSCDNPPCVNPNHLFLGTRQDNTADMDAKGRRSHKPINEGEKHPHHKLTNLQVDEIRQRFAKGGVSLSALGREFNVCYQQIRRIVQRKAWQHIGK